MTIAIIDADLVKRKDRRFPNLVSMKIAGYWRSKGEEVRLVTGGEANGLLHKIDAFNVHLLEQYDRVYVSKVFTDTPAPMENADDPKYSYGGTGYYFANAPPLPDEIEHAKPWYGLYDRQILEQAKREAELKGRFNGAAFCRRYAEYKDYSIGFLTRGCFRRCPFCVNQNKTRVVAHSPLREFYDPDRRKICLLDDNFLGYAGWRPLLEELIATGKPFKFKQGLDERLLTDDKARLLFSANYDRDYTFAFDSIRDYDLIAEKLRLIRKHTDTQNVKFYVLVGFEGTDAYDVENAFRRIELLMKHKALPYVMRYRGVDSAPWEDSQERGIYQALARWTNQPSMFKRTSFRQYCCEVDQRSSGAKNDCASKRACLDFERRYPEIARRYFDMRYELGGNSGISF